MKGGAAHGSGVQDSKQAGKPRAMRHAAHGHAAVSPILEGSSPMDSFNPFKSSGKAAPPVVEAGAGAAPEPPHGAEEPVDVPVATAVPEPMPHHQPRHQALRYGVDNCKSLRSLFKAIFGALGSTRLLTALATLGPMLLMAIVQAAISFPHNSLGMEASIAHAAQYLGAFLSGTVGVVLGFTIVAGAAALLAILHAMPNLLAGQLRGRGRKEGGSEGLLRVAWCMWCVLMRQGAGNLTPSPPPPPPPPAGGGGRLRW